MKTLRLILGDQLNAGHSWYSSVDDNVIYFMAEMRQETDYVRHHIQKVAAFFLSMRNFADSLENDGHKVIYYQIDDRDNLQDLSKNLAKLIRTEDIDRFEYQLPDEYRLDKQLGEICDKLVIPSQAFDTEHFLTQRQDLEHFFEGKKEMTMEYFYRDMRKRHDVLMTTANLPEGGKWNYDKSNRKKWNRDTEIPKQLRFRRDVSDLVNQIENANISTIGNIDTVAFNWPVSREDSLRLLYYFSTYLMVHFGEFQDAMHTEHQFLYHSRLSFALNTKMLHPKEVIDNVINYWRQNEEKINIAQVEGFVRQILGWREFMRGIYWMKMPEYANLNKLDNNNPLPSFFWSANTKMNCLHHAIKQSLDHAYAHHIQRLMVTGNFALLAQCHPDKVDEWYLGIYIDAIEWVEITNTRGMSQYADGGIVATKPYVSSANYINKMSNYCSGCHYDHKKKTGEDACPFNSLYWNFLDDKKEYFQGNQRMGMMMNLLKKIDPEELHALKERAAEIIENPDKF